LLAKTRAGSNTHAAAVERLGIAYVLVGSFERSDPLLEEARSLLGARHDDLVRTGPTVYLAVARAERGWYQGARALLDEALAVRRERAHVSQLPVAEVHLIRGLVALDEEDAAVARTELEQAITLSPTRTRGDLSRRALAYAGLATAAQLVGDGDAARAAADSRGNLRRRAVIEPDPAAAGDGTRGEWDQPLSIRAGAGGGAAAGARRGERGGAVLAREPAAGEGVAAPCRVPGGARAHREARARVEAAAKLLGPAGTAPHLRSLVANVRARLARP
jgi:tetratricopeptide (TPR) repeat protein